MKDDQILRMTTANEQSQAKAALEKALAAAQASSVLMQPGAPEWSDNEWNLEKLADRSSAACAARSIHFSSVGPVGHNAPGANFPDYWSNILKLLIIRKIHERFDKGEKYSLATLSTFSTRARHVVEGLIASGVQCVSEVTKNHMQDAFNACGENDSHQSKVKNIIKILIESGVAPQLSGIVLKGKRKNRTRVEPSEVKPVSWNDMVALAATYQMLESEQSPLKDRSDFDYLRYNMAMANLLACTPSRVSELWRLPFDAAILENPLENSRVRAAVPKGERDHLDFKFAMTWYPVKSGKPVLKPVPGAMQFVARRCLEILAVYSEAPRKRAQWIMSNPGVMPIPEELKELRAYRDMDNARIHTNEVAVLLGTQALNKCSVWQKSFERTRRTKKGSAKYDQVTYCFKTMQEDWWLEFQKRFRNAFKSDWPYVVKTPTHQLTADRALLLVFSGALNTQHVSENQLFLTTPTRNSLDAILGKSQNNSVSIWDRLGIRLPSGESPDINTHQIRHFLNTMAQRAGVPQPVIAMWSGRANIAQNATYDHRTDAEHLRAHGYDVSDYDEMQVDDLLNRQMNQLFAGQIGLPSIDVMSTPEGGIRDLEKRRLVSITQFGYCVGDLHKDPCPKAVNCLSCARLVVCKGAEKATHFLEKKVARLAAQKTELERHVEEDGGWRLGSDHILPLLEEQLSGAQDLLMALRDPDISDGAILAMRDHRGAQTATLADRTQAFIAQRKALEAERKEVTDGEA